MSTLTACEKYFGTRDVYKILDIEKAAPAKDVKKAYYKLSLLVHPDRVNAAEKTIATEKFKILSKLYQVLADKDKRALYDEQGTIDDEDDVESKLTSWLDLWKKIFKPLTEEDINNYEKSYKGSDLERTDIKKAYLSGKGCINHMMNEVPFLKVEDETRLQEIVAAMIAADDVPEYSIFVKEPAQKRSRRHKKHARESREADEIRQKMAARNSAGGGSLEQQMMERAKSREENYNSLMDKLIQKYGDEDESDSIDLNSLGKSSKRKKITPAKKNTEKLRQVKAGKVSKKRN